MTRDDHREGVPRECGADVGYLLFGSPDRSNTSLFLEARLPVDELDDANEYGRCGLGLRFRF